MAGSTAEADVDRKAAVRVVELSEDFMRDARLLIDQAEFRLNHDFNHCPVVKSAGFLPSEADLQVVDFVASFRAIAPRYLAYADALQAVSTTDVELAAAAMTSRDFASAFQKLQGEQPRMCALLREWKEQGWDPGFDLLEAMDVPDGLLTKDADLASPNRQAWRETLHRGGERLRAAGIPPQAAAEFVAYTDPFHGVVELK